jgi:hypothetical protein
MERQIRFRQGGQWTPWFKDSESLPWLNNASIEAVEVNETMTRAEFERSFSGRSIVARRGEFPPEKS